MQRLRRPTFSHPRLLAIICCFITTATLLGCSKHAVVTNQMIDSDNTTPTHPYSIEEVFRKLKPADNIVLLSFSGGGTRAAALSYGVMKALKNTPVSNAPSLLDHVVSISAVSGGSFTAAYYGLYKERLFDDFESDFLRQNLQSSLIQSVLHPKRVFKSTNRTESAIELYDQKLFKGATFADIRQDSPLIILNASDLGGGVRFSFIQRYFNLLCSDLSQFSIARAVAASSAVPLLFKPIVLKNHFGCVDIYAEWMREAFTESQNNNDPELTLTVNGLLSYYNKQERQYVHLVDGGLTDNLGLRAIYDILEVAGGAELMARTLANNRPKRLIFISIDASTSAALGIDQSAKHPTIGDTMTAITDLQLIRYNASTVELTRRQIKRWASRLSTEDHKVEPFFVHLDFNQIKDKSKRFDLNQVPTSFEIEKPQVDLLINTGIELLNTHPEFIRLKDQL